MKFLNDRPSELIEPILQIGKGVIWALTACFGIFLTIQLIKIGFALAKSEDENERKKAKQQLVWLLVGIALCIGAASIVSPLMNYLESQFNIIVI